MKKIRFFAALVMFISFSFPSYAETTVSAEVSFIFNSFLFLVCGFLVMFMAAGFAMLESGMVTSKSVSVICAKNIGLYSIYAALRHKNIEVISFEPSTNNLRILSRNISINNLL